MPDYNFGSITSPDREGRDEGMEEVLTILGKGIWGQASATHPPSFPSSSAVEGPEPGARLQTQKDWALTSGSTQLLSNQSQCSSV